MEREQMTLREQFEKITNIESLEREFELNHAMVWVYIQWLESQIHIYEAMAFNAARKVASSDEGTNYFEYQTVEDWRKP